MSVSLKSTTFSGVLLDPNGIVHRTAGMPSGANFSIGGWFNRSGTGFESFGGQQRMAFATTTGTPLDVQFYVGSGTHNYFLSDPTNGAVDSGVASTVGVWDHVAMSLNGTNIQLIVNGTSVLSQTMGSSLGTLFEYLIASLDDGFSPNKFDGEFVGILVYSRTLTAAEWNTQRLSGFAAVSTTNLYAQYRMSAAASVNTDTSGNGNDLTSSGVTDGTTEPTFSSAGQNPYVRRSVWSEPPDTPVRSRGPPVAAIAAPTVAQVDQPPLLKKKVPEVSIGETPPLPRPTAAIQANRVDPPPVQTRRYPNIPPDPTGPIGRTIFTASQSNRVDPPPVATHRFPTPDPDPVATPTRTAVAGVLYVAPTVSAPPGFMRPPPPWDGPEQTPPIRRPGSAIAAPTVAQVDLPQPGHGRPQFEAWVDVPRRLPPGAAAITAPSYVPPPLARRQVVVWTDTVTPPRARPTAAVTYVAPSVDSFPAPRRFVPAAPLEPHLPRAHPMVAAALAPAPEPEVIPRSAILFSDDPKIRLAKAQWKRTHT